MIETHTFQPLAIMQTRCYKLVLLALALRPCAMELSSSAEGCNSWAKLVYNVASICRVLKANNELNYERQN